VRQPTGGRRSLNFKPHRNKLRRPGQRLLRAAHTRALSQGPFQQGAADCGEFCEAAGAVAQRLKI